MKFLQKILNSNFKIKNYLVLANFLLVFFLILFSRTGILPMRMGDFIFFSAVYLIFALYRPGWSFLFFIGTIALENINLAPVNLGISIRPFQLAGGMTAIALAVRYFLKRLNFKLIKPKWFDFVIAIFISAGFISAFAALDKGAAFKQSAILLSFAAFYWLVRNYIQNMDDLKRVAPFFFSSGIIVVFYGILQNIRFTRGLNSFETMPGRPNSTFTEPDWLGIYLVVLIAVLYAIIFCINKAKDNSKFQISNDQFPISNKIQNSKFKIQNFSLYVFACYFLLAVVFVLLIITVSRSAWLGAGFITLVFFKAILTNFSFHPSNWRWKELLRHFIFTVAALALSVGIIYIFNLTRFQLFSRLNSVSSGLQKITVSCVDDFKIPEVVENVNDLRRYNCKHINLEDVEKEKAEGKIIKEIFRDDPNIKIRSKVYQKSMAQIKSHPILGIGWGNISKALGEDERGIGLNASNILLEVWLGSGILGLLAFLVVGIYIFVRSAAFVLMENAKSKIIGAFILLSFFAFLIPNLFNAGVFLGIFWVWLGIALSLGYYDKNN